MDQKPPTPWTAPEVSRERPAATDPQGIASASRSCLVILALGVVIILLICVSTTIRLIWG
ncbi:MAG: hypothetical protein ACR2LS_11200 [Thermomicrobiales bacterium]